MPNIFEFEPDNYDLHQVLCPNRPPFRLFKNQNYTFIFLTHPWIKTKAVGYSRVRQGLYGWDEIGLAYSCRRLHSFYYKNNHGYDGSIYVDS